MTKALRIAGTIGVIAILLFAYWYQSGSMVCPVPIAYRLGSVDPRFELNEAAALAYIAEAEAIWEQSVGRELFVYDATAKFPINFIFDDRQAEAKAEARDRSTLDDVEAQNEALVAEIETLRRKYDVLVKEHERLMIDYEADRAEHNATVASYNEQGGAPPDVFATLKEDRAALDRRATELDAKSANIRSLTDKINELVAKANDQIENYNQNVSVYNDRYGDQGEITQGEYQGTEINVYKFTSDEELVAVLAHELGHALGIGHVAEEGSLMYYLLEDPIIARALSSADIAAFTAVCGAEETTEQRIRRYVRETFN